MEMLEMKVEIFENFGKLWDENMVAFCYFIEQFLFPNFRNPADDKDEHFTLNLLSFFFFKYQFWEHVNNWRHELEISENFGKPCMI